MLPPLRAAEERGLRDRDQTGAVEQHLQPPVRLRGGHRCVVVPRPLPGGAVPRLPIHPVRPLPRGVGDGAEGAGFVQGVWRTDAGKCLFLQTLQEGVHSGHYCEKRQAWLKAQLDADDDPVFLFMHHPPFEIGIVGMDGSRMLDSEALWSILEPHQTRIRHLFFGHIHRPIFGSWRGVPVSCMRSTNQQLALDLRDQTENPDIMRVPGNMEEPAYGVVLADRDTVIVHMHEYRRRTPEFLFIPPPDNREGRSYALDMKLEGFAG